MTKPRRAWTIAAMTLALGFLGCEHGPLAPGHDDGGDEAPAAADGDGDTDGDTDGDADGDADDDTDEGSDTDTVCDEQSFDIEIVPVRLMILQDMSGSMTMGYPSKWSQTVPALTTVLTDWEGSQIEFGFDIFPDGTDVGPFGSECGVWNDVMYAPAPGTADDIIAYISAAEPAGASTPLWCALANYDFDGPDTYVEEMHESGVDRYIMVVSDGGDGCGTACSMGGQASPTELGDIAANLLETWGIKTFVIGFGAAVDADQLNAIAANGGTEFDTFFPADDEAELYDALETIASAVISCVFDIEEPEATANPDDVNFFFDDEIVYYDEDCAAGVGWTWVDDDHTQVEFCEAACQQLEDGLVDEISAIFGCPTEAIE